MPGEFRGSKLTFGKGGGFTGRINTYCLLENGDLFKNSGDSLNVKYLGKLNRTKTDQIFKSFYLLGLDQQDIDSPGNMYSLIEMKDNSGVKKVQWGSAKEKPSDEMKIYFSNLMYAVKTLENQ